MAGYWNEDNEWVRIPEADFSWKKLKEQLDEMPEEDLLGSVVMTDFGGSEVFGRELKRGQHGLYIKGD